MVTEFSIDPILRGELSELFGADYTATLIAQAETLGNVMDASGVQSRAKPPFLNGKDDDDDEDDDKALKTIASMIILQQKRDADHVELKNRIISLESRISDLLTERSVQAININHGIHLFKHFYLVVYGMTGSCPVPII